MSALETGLAFLEANKTKDGVKTTSTGLQYKVIEEGAGAKPAASNTVEVHYRGTHISGAEFDSSYARNQPAQFPLNAVISGWTEGVQLMPEGSKFQFYIPSELAYGERDIPGIPGNSVLIFDVELLKIM